MPKLNYRELPLYIDKGKGGLSFNELIFLFEVIFISAIIIKENSYVVFSVSGRSDIRYLRFTQEVIG